MSLQKSLSFPPVILLLEGVGIRSQPCQLFPWRNFLVQLAPQYPGASVSSSVEWGWQQSGGLRCLEVRGTRQMPQGHPSTIPLHCPAILKAAPHTLLLPSIQGKHVHGVGDKQQEAEWRPHLGSLVQAGVRGALEAPTTQRLPCGGGAAGRGGRSRRIRGRGVSPAARDPPSALGPASRSSEGVGRARTRRAGRSWRFGGGALTR